MPRRPVFRNDRVHVCRRRCSTCIFFPDNRMNLSEGRVEEMVATALSQEGGSITCHDTLDGDQAICRGFWTLHGMKVQLLQVADRLGIVEYVEPVKSSDETQR